MTIKQERERLVVDFCITLKCNYKCPYCDQGVEKKDYPSADEVVVGNLIKFINETKKKLLIQLVGGEPTIHPAFLKITEEIIKNNHQTQICTNFSKPIDFWEKYIDLTKDKLVRIQISYHPTQIKDKEEFIAKLLRLNEIKHKNTEFILSAVLTEENFEDIKYLKERLKNTDLKVDLQHKVDSKGNFVEYSSELENYLKENSQIKTMNDKGEVKTFGTYCKAGKNFIILGPTGNVSRCYHMKNKLTYLGNIKENFTLYKNSLPCMAEKCTCSLPYQMGCIDLEKKSPLFAKICSFFGKHTKLSRKFKKIFGEKIECKSKSASLKQLWINVEDKHFEEFKNSDLIKNLNENSVCIDCGANVGKITELFLSKGAEVYSFEPYSLCFKELEKKFGENKKVHLYHAGVLDKNTTMKLYKSIHQDYDDLFFSQGASMYSSKSEIKQNEYEEVQVIDLSEFIEKLNKPIDILKIDIEGAEYDVLEKIIAKKLYENIKHILVETHDETIPEIREKSKKIRSIIKGGGLEEKINLNWV